MPIGSDEWKEGRTQDTTETRILNFLQSNKEKAFTEYEIIEEINPLIPWALTEDWKTISKKFLVNFFKAYPINQALERLMEEGKVEAKEIETSEGKKTYYKAV